MPMADDLHKLTDPELDQFACEATVIVEHGWGASYAHFDRIKFASLIERAVRIDERKTKESHNAT